MKFILPALSALLLTAFAASGDDEYPVAVKSLPAAVPAAVQEYFPGSEILSVTADEDDDRRVLDLRVEHKGVVLRMETRPDGRVREIDLDRGYGGLGALLGREASLETLSVEQLPSAVTAALSDFFVETKISGAAEGTNDEQKFYRVRLRRLSLTLRVDITADGRLLDIDTAN